MLFLIGIAIHAVIGQTPAGTINVDGKEVEIFYKIKGTPVVPPPPVVVDIPPANTTDLSIKDAKAADCIGDKKKVTFTPTGGSGSYEIRYGTFPEVWYSVASYALEMRTDWNWDVFIKDKISRKVLKVSIQVNNCGWPTVFKTTNDNGAVTVPPIVEAENNQVESVPVILPDNQTPTYEGFGKTGIVYTSKKRGKLILPSHNNSGGPQIFKVSRNGTEIYSYNRPAGWQPESAYWGNHGKESQFAVDAGKLDFYFKNTHSKPVIVGFTTGNAYSFYDIPGELEKTNYFKELEPGEECNFSQYFENNTMFESVEKNWNKTANTFQFTCPFFENGIVTTDRILEGNGPNGFTVDENRTSTHKFYKQSNPSINTTIRFITKSIYEEPTFEILEINGLNIIPEFTMLTCYSVTQGKVFCNDSNGYIWSKYYKTF